MPFAHRIAKIGWESVLNTKREQISKMICSYLRKHPVAEDTLEGIAEWWLEAEKIETSVDEVADALESLVQEGIVSVRKTQSGINLYKVGCT